MNIVKYSGGKEGEVSPLPFLSRYKGECNNNAD